MAGWFGFGVTVLAATACTVATSALVMYATNYLLKNHHATTELNKFKRFIKKQLSEIDIYNKEIQKHESKLNATLEDKNEREVLFLNEEFVKILIGLDQINPKQSEINEKALDDESLQFLVRQIEKVRGRKREMIEKIHLNCKKIDSLNLISP
jgi:uncharacterized protein YxeA